MTEIEKAIRDFCGHHADWWPSTTQVQEMLALAQPEQEPVAWWNDTGTHIDLNVSGRGTPLYTTPPQRKPQEFVCSTGLCHYRKPLTNDRAHQILLDMAKHIETFGDENITEQALSAECIRFILERVTAYGIKEEV